jgi:hypothetical protein
MIQAKNTESEILRRDFENAFLREQTTTERVMRGPKVAETLAQAEASLQLADKYKADAASTRALLQPQIDEIRANIQYRKDMTDIERNKSIAFINEANAKIREADAGVAFRQEQTLGLKQTREQQDILFPKVQEKTQAEIDTEKARSAQALAQRNVALKELETYGKVKVGGKDWTIAARDYVNSLEAAASLNERRTNKQADLLERERDNRRQEQEIANKAEQEIVNPKFTDTTPDQQSGYVNAYHQNSYSNYVYLLQPGGSWFNPWGATEEYKPVQLPNINGYQLTARDVWELAQKAGVSVEQYVRNVIFQGKQVPYGN